MPPALLERLQQVFNLANQQYGTNFSFNTVHVGTLDPSLGAMGRATHYEDGSFSLELNLEEDHRLLADDTIPHEVAHLICFHNPRLGQDHDQGWKEICRDLGGNYPFFTGSPYALTGPMRRTINC
jgi:predicted SprT family Zn-dependent metalloprotease